MMQRIIVFLLLVWSCALPAAEGGTGWVTLFNGQDLTGWTANENPDTFKVVDGAIVVKGPRSHLFYTGPVNGAKFRNFEFETEIKTLPNANSGIYFHTAHLDSGFPNKGYEVQVNNSHRDPKRTAGLYGIQDHYEAPARDGEWFTLNIRVEGRRVVTRVNGKVIVDYTEPDNLEGEKRAKGRRIGEGTFALQGHDPGSEVHYRNIRLKVLP
jgi:hypothetical protein